MELIIGSFVAATLLLVWQLATLLRQRVRARVIARRRR